MKEYPILFSAEMVRAILEERKTQTRQVIKPQPQLGQSWHKAQKWWVVDPHEMDLPISFCSYGIPGDRLWVRETFWHRTYTPGVDDCEGCGQIPPGGQTYLYCATDKPPSGMFAELYTKRPSIHMPRWASRITLEVISVKVERVQDITGNDAMAEGCQNHFHDGYDFDYTVCSPAQANFRRLWDSVNAKRGFPWSSNPWVWVVEFKRI